MYNFIKKPVFRRFQSWGKFFEIFTPTFYPLPLPFLSHPIIYMGSGCTKFVATMTCKNSNCCSGNNIQVIETDIKLAHERLDKLDEILQITKALEKEYLHRHRKSYKNCLKHIEKEIEVKI